MALKIEDIKIEGYERVIHATNEATKLDCVIAIHNTKLGPALGGVRSWEYRSFEDQKNDAPRCGTSWRASFDILKLQKEYFIIDRETGIAIWRNNDIPNDIDFDSETITWNEFQECRSRMGFDVIDSTTGLQRMYKLRKL